MNIGGLEDMNDINITGITTWFAGATWSVIDAFITIVTVLGVLYALYKHYRQSQPIKLLFKVVDKNDKLIDIPLSLTRRNVTRAELTGLMGMIQKDSTKRHNIVYTSNDNYLQSIYSIQNAKSSQLIINITSKELEQFDI